MLNQFGFGKNCIYDKESSLDKVYIKWYSQIYLFTNAVSKLSPQLEHVTLLSGR